MSLKSFIQQAAKSAAIAACSQFQVKSSNSSLVFIGTVNQDRTIITDESGIQYNLIYSDNIYGYTVPAIKINSNTAMAIGQKPPFFECDGGLQNPYLIVKTTSSPLYPFYLLQMNKPENVVALDFSDITVDDPWIYTDPGTKDGCVPPFTLRGRKTSGVCFSQDGTALIQYTLSETQYMISPSFYYPSSPLVCSLSPYLVSVPSTSFCSVSFKIYPNFSIGLDKDNNPQLMGTPVYYNNLSLDLSGLTYPEGFPPLSCDVVGGFCNVPGSTLYDQPKQTSQTLIFNNNNDPNSIIFSYALVDGKPNINFIGGYQTIKQIFCIQTRVVTIGTEPPIPVQAYLYCGANSVASYGTYVRGILNSEINESIVSDLEESGCGGIEPQIDFPGFTSFFFSPTANANQGDVNLTINSSNGVFYNAAPTYFSNNHTLTTSSNTGIINNTDFFTCNSSLSFTREGTFADNNILRAKFLNNSTGLALTHSTNEDGSLSDPIIYTYSYSIDPNTHLPVINLGRTITGTIPAAGEYFILIDYTLR